MSGPKDPHAHHHHEHAEDETATEATEEREVYLRDGRRLTISEAGQDQVVEIRGQGGLLELRIQLTEQGPVLQMEAIKMSLKASEAVEIAAPLVQISATDVNIEAEHAVDVTAKEGDVVVVGKKIWLN